MLITFNCFVITLRRLVLKQVRASGRSRKKSQISWDKFAEKTADFAGIFEASFAEKRLVKLADFVRASRANFSGKRSVLR